MLSIFTLIGVVVLIVTCLSTFHLVAMAETKRPKDEWTILGFEKLLEASKRGRREAGNLRPTVTQRTTGKVFVIELFEVRKLPDGSIERVDD